MLPLPSFLAYSLLCTPARSSEDGWDAVQSDRGRRWMRQCSEARQGSTTLPEFLGGPPDLGLGWERGLPESRREERESGNALTRLNTCEYLLVLTLWNIDCSMHVDGCNATSSLFVPCLHLYWLVLTRLRFIKWLDWFYDKVLPNRSASRLGMLTKVLRCWIFDNMTHCC